jgi:predicted protein tyrosine phosphatase
MIEKIIVLSRKDVEKMLLEFHRHPAITGNWALISIYSDSILIDIKQMEILKVLDCTTFISICFDDITKKEFEIKVKNNDKLKLFSLDHAKSIISFIDSINKSQDIKTLVIHCAAGVSRSGAVGLFANRYLNLDEKELSYNNPLIKPNEYILDLLTSMSGLKDKYIKFWENTKIIKP